MVFNCMEFSLGQKRAFNLLSPTMIIRLLQSHTLQYSGLQIELSYTWSG